MKKLQTKEERIIKMREYYERTRDQRKAYDRKRYAENKAVRLAYVHAWRLANPDKVRAADKSWVERNREVKRLHSSARNSRFKQQFPKWLSALQRAELRRIYRDCPKGYHVDHIVPIKGDIVSGLHVPWNLQYLSAKENLSKGNRCA